MAHIIQKAEIRVVYVTLLLLVPQCFYAWLKILVKCVYLIIFYAHVEETKMGKLSNETELKLRSFIMCGFIFWVAVPPPHCENQTYNQHQGCARGILLKCSHICTNGKSFTSRVADIFHYFIFIIISQTLTEEFIPCIDLLTTFKMEEICWQKFQCTSKCRISWMKH